MNRISVAQPKLNGNERKYVLDCLDTNWISSNGKYIGQFEETFARSIASNPPAAGANDFVRMSELLTREAKRSGRKKVEALDYLFAFMTLGEGLAGRVFGELGITPQQVAAHLQSGAAGNQTMPRF